MRRFALLLTLVTVAACGGDSSTQPSASVAGSYALQTVNDTPLPWTAAQNGADKWEVVSDVIVLSDSGTYSETIVNRYTRSGQVTNENVPDAGTYAVTGTGISFKSADGWQESGSIGKGMLVLRGEGAATPYAAVYQRQ